MHWKLCSNLVRLITLWSVVTSAFSANTHLYVSPTGSDSNSGSGVGSPVKTFQHAIDKIRNKEITGDTVYVELMAGYHDLDHTIQLNDDLGTTVVIRAYQGKEIHMTGGRRVDVTKFHPVTDSHVRQRLPQVARDKVLELDLTSAGLTDLGTLRKYGFWTLWEAPLEIFINGQPLQLAQWPNNEFINIKSMPDGEKGRRFTYDAAGRDSNWAKEAEPWVYGWWYWSWADSSIPVKTIDPHSHTITLADPGSEYGLRVGHYDPDRGVKQAGYSDQGGYFRVINMLCELDQPGEYYIDRTSKKLYVWPNTGNQRLGSADIVYVSMLRECIQMDSSVKRVHFQDFTLEYCRQFGFDMHNTHQVTFTNMEVANTGSFGIYCRPDCRNISVLASEFHDVGGGVRLEGGDRTTLAPSGNLVEDNHMWRYSRMGAIPADAVHIEGVHSTVTHNHLHHGQYTAIRWAGNDHVMEYNDVHHVCWNSSDCGAIHSGRDWTFRGNVIRYNYIHDTRRYLPGADVRGIMLDDQYSSVLIEHNVFYNNDVHANIGGGRDNVIRDNVMYDAIYYSIQIDGRGLGSGGFGPTLHQRLDASSYKTSIWTHKYPELANILSKHPVAPEGNQIYRNVYYNNKGIPFVYTWDNTLRRNDYFNVHNNYRAYQRSDFMNAVIGNFKLRCDATTWVNENHFEQPLYREETGPRVPTGPNYLRIHRQPPGPMTTPVSIPCDFGTAAPATVTPRSSYMPDGSAPNTLYPDIKEGCWLIVDHCPKHTEAEGTHKDSTGTATGTEQGCLARAAQQWRYCGSPSSGTVMAVYGHTGAMTISGEGCLMVEYNYGCDQKDDTMGFHRDNWAEQNINAAHDQEACLNRAQIQWNWCGHHTNYPITSVYGPTGNFRTAGPGCWIKMASCPAQSNLAGYFYDKWGATNAGTDDDETECFQRADYFWKQCGSHSNAPVTAYFRPHATNSTVP